MTQVEKELLLRDLCMRLPYGVVMATGYGKSLLTSIRVNDSNEKLGINVDPALTRLFNVNEVKPYLFPLSSMTEEQKKEFLSAAGYEIREEDCGRHTETYYYDMVGHERDFYPNTEAVDWCRKNHFDIYGLIPMDLAIDATNKNIY